MSALLNDRRVRDASLQIGFVGGLAAMLALLAITAQGNMEAQGLTSGFGFLERGTGWRVGFSLIEYGPQSSYGRVILVGLLNSLFLGAIALPLATVIGVTVGVMRTSGNGMAELIGAAYVETFRNVPMILQLFFWYTLLVALPSPRAAEPVLGLAAFTGRGIYLPGLNVFGGAVFAAFLVLLAAVAIAVWLGPRRWRRIEPRRARRARQMLCAAALICALGALALGRIPGETLLSIPEPRGLNYRGGIRVSPELSACIVAISIYGGAYIAEIIRSGFNAIPKGQAEAGRALGLPAFSIFTRIRLPLAIRIVMPTMINQYVWLFKATTIGIAVGFSDFFMVVSTSINQAGQTMELIAILMGGFLLINYSIAWGLNRVNDAIKLKGAQLRI